MWRRQKSDPHRTHLVSGIPMSNGGEYISHTTLFLRGAFIFFPGTLASNLTLRYALIWKQEFSQAPIFGKLGTEGGLVRAKQKAFQPYFFFLCSIYHPYYLNATKKFFLVRCRAADRYRFKFKIATLSVREETASNLHWDSPEHRFRSQRTFNLLIAIEPDYDAQKKKVATACGILWQKNPSNVARF